METQAVGCYPEGLHATGKGPNRSPSCCYPISGRCFGGTLSRFPRDTKHDTYGCVYVKIHIHTCICLFICTCVYRCIHPHTHVYVYMYTHVCLHIHTCTRKQMCIVHTCIYTCIYIYTCLYAHYDGMPSILDPAHVHSPQLSQHPFGGWAQLSELGRCPKGRGPVTGSCFSCTSLAPSADNKASGLKDPKCQGFGAFRPHRKGRVLVTGSEGGPCIIRKAQPFKEGLRQFDFEVNHNQSKGLSVPKHSCRVFRASFCIGSANYMVLSRYYVEPYKGKLGEAMPTTFFKTQGPDIDRNLDGLQGHPTNESPITNHIVLRRISSKPAS